jgi:hypothetical protein
MRKFNKGIHPAFAKASSGEGGEGGKQTVNSNHLPVRISENLAPLVNACVNSLSSANALQARFRWKIAIHLLKTRYGIKHPANRCNPVYHCHIYNYLDS